MNYSFKKLVINSPERLGHDKYYILSSSKVRGNFNWKPEISLDSGIERTIQWAKKNLNSFSRSDEVYYHKK